MLAAGRIVARKAARPAFHPASLAEALFAELKAIGFDGTGVTRAAFGALETRAIEHLEARAQSLDLVAGRDPGSNLTIDLPGEDRRGPAIMIGSHLDSVPQGGAYDGTAGVLAGLLCLLRLKEKGVQPPCRVRVVGLRGEESPWFGVPYLGSSILLGRLDPDHLQLTRRGDGATLATALAELGVDLDRVRQRQPLVDLGGIAAWLELHIEQGPVMVARDLAAAAVSGIRGNVRYPAVLCRGEAGHSGAVPRWLRRDAVFAVSELVMRLDEHWSALQERGHDLVVTVGVIGTNPAEHSETRIPGEVRFSLEFRSESLDTLQEFDRLIRSECGLVSRTRNVEFVFGRKALTAPARLDATWTDRLARAAAARGYGAEILSSGAGHDAAVFAHAGIPAAMVFVRNAHGSHNPREAMTTQDFMAGVDVLYDAILATD